MGDIQFTAPDSAGFMKGATFTVAAIDSAGNNSSGPGSTSLYMGATIPTPVSALKVGGCFDYLDIHNGGVTGNHGNDSAYNIALYASIQATDKLSFNMRAEYLNAENIGGTSGMFYPRNTAEEFTATAQYNLWANVISRVEFRWDHTDHGNLFGASSGATTSGNPNKDNDFLLALNLIYQF